MAVSDQVLDGVLGGVLAVVGVVTVFAAVVPGWRAQREASVLKEQLAHLSRGERRELARVVLRGRRGERGRGVAARPGEEALVVAQLFWGQRWTAVSSAGVVVVMVAGVGLQPDRAGWLLALLVAAVGGNVVLAVLSAVRAVAGRRYLRGAATAAV